MKPSAIAGNFMEPQLMKIHLARILGVAGLLLGIGLPALAPAADPATGYPAPSARDQAIRKIGAVYLDEGYLVIEDQIFLLSSSTRIYRANGVTGNLADLRKGMYVNIRVTATPASAKPVLTDVRIVR
jgi:hypothetical protein